MTLADLFTDKTWDTASPVKGQIQDGLQVAGKTFQWAYMGEGSECI